MFGAEFSGRAIRIDMSDVVRLCWCLAITSVPISAQSCPPRKLFIVSSLRLLSEQAVQDIT